MKIEIDYPEADKQRRSRLRLIAGCKWGFLFAGIICVAVNASTGGSAWSLIVIWSMRSVWTQLVSPDMVEFNRISQTIKLIVNTCVLLFLIDLILAPGWATEVIAIICFSALLLVSALFFTDLETQRQNMFPMLFFCVVCLVGSVVGLIARHGEESWPLAVLGAIALSLLIGCAAKLGKELLLACKKYFCTK